MYTKEYVRVIHILDSRIKLEVTTTKRTYELYQVDSLY